MGSIYDYIKVMYIQYVNMPMRYSSGITVFKVLIENERFDHIYRLCRKRSILPLGGNKKK